MGKQKTTYGNWDDYLNELSHITKFCEKTHNDWPFLMMGDEGGGKSTLGIKTALELDETFDIEKQIVYTLKDYANLTLDLIDQPYKAILWDEAVDSLFSRTYSANEQVKLVQLYIKNRSLQQYPIITIPSMFYIDKYMRSHRIKTVNYCWIDRQHFDKRYFAMYFRSSFKNILMDKQKAEHMMLDRSEFIKYYPPDYIFEFTGLQKTSIWDKYEKLKYKNQKDTIKNIVKELQALEDSKRIGFNRNTKLDIFLNWLLSNFPAKDKLGNVTEDYLEFTQELVAKEAITAKGNINLLVNRCINLGLVKKIGARQYYITSKGKALIEKRREDQEDD
jgi:hypothetical protein